jgi:two-component system OmpR family response regulator
VAAAFAPRIYLVDPDPVALGLLAEYLRDRGFDVVATSDMGAPPPPVDGMVVALEDMPQQEKRPAWLGEKPAVPLVVLDRSRVFPGRAVALGYTPDARLTLPVQPRRLVATIRRVMSVARIESLGLGDAPVRVYRFARWRLHPAERRLEADDGVSNVLDPREFEVLKVLLTFPRQLLTRQQLIAMVWGAGAKVDNRTLDRPITCLRRHLGEDARFPALLKTVVGLGYRLDVDVEISR